MPNVAMLAQAATDAMPDPRVAWLPVVLMILIAVAFAAGTLVFSVIIGPRRDSAVKQGVYESGMIPVGDARRRFNVRFYLVAMIFLVFDVEIVFFYPWATLFPAVSAAGSPLAGLLLVEIIIFVGLLLVAYFYAWGKGVFRWD